MEEPVPAENPPTPLASLRQFFDSIRRVVRSLGTPPAQHKPKWRQERVAMAKAWTESEPERREQVAVCPKCPTWFKTTDARNAHRAECKRVG